MIRRAFLSLFALAILGGCVGDKPEKVELHPARERSDAELAKLQEDYTGDIYPFFEEFCFSCHGIRKKEAGIDLKAAVAASEIGTNYDTWNRVRTMLQTGQMPPKDEEQPSQSDRDEIAAFVDTELEASIRATRPDPGRVTARRLNRQEYENTIWDLLGVRAEAARAFPVDDSGYGFDNIGDVLSLSPLLMEKYLASAETIAAAVIKQETAAVENTESKDKQKPRVFVCGHTADQHVAGCANAIVRGVAERAYRRPVTKDELRGLTALVDMVEDEGGTFEEGIQLALEAILVSPNFLFRIEGNRDHQQDALRHIDDFEMASRLSYFLWSSMPDDELFALAHGGTVREPEVLKAQVARMIKDEKASRFVENFAGQWLELRNLDLVDRIDELFPEFNRELRDAMRKESELYFDAILRENRSILDFLQSDFTFVNQRLAEFYGIAGVEGKEHRRVAVDGVERGGVLTHASVLTLTSYPARTSPVIRGAWVLQNILGTTPPPPPPDVPKLEDDPRKLTGTIREQLEQHRSNPTCASCHSRIDPLGFGLENYDAIGRWRTQENEHPVDSSGVLPTGQSFNGSAELRAILMAKPEDFVRCFTEKMLTYALGRGVEPYDRPVVSEIMSRVAAEDYRFQALIDEIVLSVPFNMRRGEGAGKA